jgi:hypothetical protein
MYCYLWDEISDPNECKFGERFVKPGQDPATEVLKRVKSSLGVRSDLLKDGRVVIRAIWDVSILAETVGRNRIHGRMDDYLRTSLPRRKNTTGEIHLVPGLEFCIKVNQLLSRFDQPLVDLELSLTQQKVASETVQLFLTTQIILADLCARFGKTVWSAAVATERETELVIIASYIKTVFTSFAKDLTTFEQFSNYVHVDCKEDDYQDTISEALNDGKKVVAYLSLGNGSKRQSRIDFLFSWKNKETMLIVDEADFGAHTEKQSLPLIAAVGKDAKVLIMTGTNSDRAANNWKIDSMLSVTYPELLVEKRFAQKENKALLP